MQPFLEFRNLDNSSSVDTENNRENIH